MPQTLARLRRRRGGPHRSEARRTMARDEGLEAIVRVDLYSVANVSEKAMFGGWAWLLGGHLLCGARGDGMLVRLGKGRDAWALARDGIEPMVMRGRPLGGWVRVGRAAF